MEKKDKIKFDLNFLDEKPAEKAKPSEKKKDPAKPETPPAVEGDLSNNPYALPISKYQGIALGALVIAVIVILAVANGGDSNSVASSSYTDTSTSSYTDSKVDFTPAKEDSGSVKTTEKTTAKTTSSYTPPPQKTGIEFCRDANGPHASYDPVENACGCESGYYYGETTKQCVSLIDARNQSCAAEWSNSSFLKYDTDGKTSICDCNAGYEWNNERTACFTPTAFSQSCKTAYGQGSYSSRSSTDGKRYCDCGSGYDWNPDQSACVTTASINQICERDVGRNSRYSGTVKDGKYMCTDPY